MRAVVRKRFFKGKNTTTLVMVISTEPNALMNLPMKLTEIALMIITNAQEYREDREGAYAYSF